MSKKKTAPVVWTLNFPLSNSVHGRLVNELARHVYDPDAKECSCGTKIDDGDYDWHLIEVAFIFGRISR